MRIGVPAETRAGETRVAMTPETAKKLKAQGHTLLVQSGAGLAASVTDAAYEAVGVEISDAAGALSCELVLKVSAPSAAELKHMKSGAALVGMLNPFDAEGLGQLAAAGLTSFALEAAPRTTRAQSMDVLSSQANIAGYKAVMVAADKYQRFVPMLMTAAGTVKAARVVILGVGVAGLQAIATAKRLGAVIEATDVRPSVKEQVESLGAKFIDVPFETAEEKEAAEGVAGYARPMPASWLDRQKVEVAKRVAQADLVITTGGLGPTCDDITRERIAELLGRTLVFDSVVSDAIQAFFQSRGRPVPPRTRVEAMVPQGAIVVPNGQGTAPGLMIEASPNPFRPEGKRSWLVMLPGPPREHRPARRRRRRSRHPGAPRGSTAHRRG